MKLELSTESSVFLSIPQAAAYLGCTEGEIEDLISRGAIRLSTLPFHRKRRVVWKHDLLDFKKNNRADGLCGFCPTSCAICKRAHTRTMVSFRFRDKWVSSLLLRDPEACELLKCSQTDLERAMAHGVIRYDTKRTGNLRVCYDDVIAMRSKSIEFGWPLTDERPGLVSILGNRILQIKAARFAIEARMREWGITQQDELFPFGSYVDRTDPPTRGWYVYHLCRADGRPFYIGKGLGKRMYQHAIEARKGGTSHKCRYIRKMWRDGGEIQYRVVFVTESEEEAYACERLEIARIGLNRLTNVEEGGPISVETGRRMGYSRDTERLTYVQFIELLPIIAGRWVRLTKERRQLYIRNWAMARTMRLFNLAHEARQSWHYEGAEMIEREIRSIEYFTMEQDELRIGRTTIRDLSMRWGD